MNRDDLSIQELSYLTLLSKEGAINERQFERLEALLQADRLARQYYIDLIDNEWRLYDTDVLQSFSFQGPLSLRDLQELAEYEKTAPQLDLPEERPQRELIRNVVYPPRAKRKISPFSIAWLTATAAIALFMFFFLQFVPERMIVAEVSRTLNAQWSGGSTQLAEGDFLYNTDESRVLKSGIVEVRFAYGATVVLEGPCEFSGQSAGLLDVQYGRVYATVPVQASGFTIETPFTRVVDIGTEFGVRVDIDGSSSVHMLKGRASLVSGTRKKDAQSQQLTEGQARRVDTIGQTYEIPVDPHAFVRKILPDTKLPWRGEPLVSVVSLPAVGTDMASGISPSKTYTHLLDFGGGDPATINDVSFTQVDHSEIRQDRFEDALNRFQLQRNGGMGLFQTYQQNKASAELFSDGGIRDLLTDYTYHAANKSQDWYTLTLTGLNPGTHYSLRLYYCPQASERAAREVHLTFSTGSKETEIVVDEAAKGAHYVSYDYIADGPEVSVRFKAKSVRKDWQLFGVTNEAVTWE